MLPQPKLVKAIVFDLLHFHAETDGSPLVCIPLPAVPAPIASIVPTLVDDMLEIEVPIASALLTLANIVLAAAVFSIATQIASDNLFANIVPVVVIPTAFYALCSPSHWQDQLEQ